MISFKALKCRSLQCTLTFFGAICFLFGSSVRSTPASDKLQEGPAKTKTIEIPFTSHDGHRMFGKLTLPNSSGLHPVLIYVQTAEGATVDIRRPNGRGGTFNYFDLYREKLPELNVAFFSYEGRGIRMGDAPPRYEQIDWDVYNTSTLENKVRDALTAIEVVRKQPGIDGSQIFLMGTSEGTMLAAETATRAPKPVKGLVLYAVLSNTLKDALRYMSADGAFLALRRFFDTDKDGKISKNEFDADALKYRERALKDVGFQVFDSSGDGNFTVDEMRTLRKTRLDAIETNNYAAMYEWLKVTAAVSIPKGWLEDHFAHPAMWTFLSRLDLPIGFFHGDADNLTPIEDVKKLEEQAKRSGKTEMKFHYFQDLDHSLGIGAYFVRGTLPEGHRAIFEYIKNQVQKK
jgi:pimeloyl-ACP methyl ester carboxylesterase